MGLDRRLGRCPPTPEVGVDLKLTQSGLAVESANRLEVCESGDYGVLSSYEV